MSPNHEALRRAIEIKSGQLPLARSIGTTQSNVWEWLNRSKNGTAVEFVIPIERETGVPRHELRRDIYPPPDAAEAEVPVTPQPRPSADAAHTTEPA